MAKRRFIVENVEGDWAGVVADEIRGTLMGLFFDNHRGTDLQVPPEMVVAFAAKYWVIALEVPESAEWPDGLKVIYGGEDVFTAPPQKRNKEEE